MYIFSLSPSYSLSTYYIILYLNISFPFFLRLPFSRVWFIRPESWRGFLKYCSKQTALAWCDKRENSAFYVLFYQFQTTLKLPPPKRWIIIQDSRWCSKGNVSDIKKALLNKKSKVVLKYWFGHFPFNGRNELNKEQTYVLALRFSILTKKVYVVIIGRVTALWTLISNNLSITKIIALIKCVKDKIQDFLCSLSIGLWCVDASHPCLKWETVAIRGKCKSKQISSHMIHDPVGSLDLYWTCFIQNAQKSIDVGHDASVKDLHI